MKQLCKTKENVKYLSCVMYEGFCSCEVVAETIRNEIIKKDE